MQQKHFCRKVVFTGTAFQIPFVVSHRIRVFHLALAQITDYLDPCLAPISQSLKALNENKFANDSQF